MAEAGIEGGLRLPIARPGDTVGVLLRRAGAGVDKGRHTA